MSDRPVIQETPQQTTGILHASADASARVGSSTGDCEIMGILGEDETGVLYSGRRAAKGGQVTLKILHDRCTHNKAVVERLIAEVKAAQSIRHPNVASFTDFGIAPDGTVFLTMEYLPGESLRARLRQVQRLPPFEAINVMRQAARGLGAAHEAGIVHGSLKPDSIFLCKHEGRRRIVRRSKARGMRYAVEQEESFDLVKLLDFGMARLPSPSSGDDTGLAGSLRYLSPEQAQGQPADQRSDIYSLGVVFYEMVTGALPFGGDSLPDILRAQALGGVIPPSRRAPGVGIDARIDALILRCLKKNPLLRLASAGELCSALDACITDSAFLRDAHRLPGIAESGIDLSEGLPKSRDGLEGSAEAPSTAPVADRPVAAPAPQKPSPVVRIAPPPAAKPAVVSPPPEPAPVPITKETTPPSALPPEEAAAPIEQKPLTLPTPPSPEEAAAPIEQKPLTLPVPPPPEETVAPIEQKPLTLPAPPWEAPTAPIEQKPLTLPSPPSPEEAAAPIEQKPLTLPAPPWEAAAVPIVQKPLTLPAPPWEAAAVPIVQKPMTLPSPQAFAEASSADDPAAAMITPPPVVPAEEDPAAAMITPPPVGAAGEMPAHVAARLDDKPRLRIPERPEQVSNVEEQPAYFAGKRPRSHRPRLFALFGLLLLVGGFSVWAERQDWLSGWKSIIAPMLPLAPTAAPSPSPLPALVAPSPAPAAAVPPAAAPVAREPSVASPPAPAAAVPAVPAVPAQEPKVAPPPAPAAQEPKVAPQPELARAVPAAAPSPPPSPAAPVAPAAAPTTPRPSVGASAAKASRAAAAALAATKRKPVTPAKSPKVAARGSGKHLSARARAIAAKHARLAASAVATPPAAEQPAPAAEAKPESEPAAPREDSAEPAKPEPPNAEDLLREAQRIRKRGHFAAAISGARAALAAEPTPEQTVRAYEIIGICACSLSDTSLAREAASHLGKSNRDVVKAMCEAMGQKIE